MMNERGNLLKHKKLKFNISIHCGNARNFNDMNKTKTLIWLPWTIKDIDPDLFYNVLQTVVHYQNQTVFPIP